MANTIKLGNGTWATKEGSLLAYNDENNNFKPLPFTTTRASSASVVNKKGLIETVGSGIPRIDFSDDAKGALLLEPTATNLVVYSEDFTQADWDNNGSVITPNQSISPSGVLNASLVSAPNAGNRFADVISSTGGTYTFSFYVKAKEGESGVWSSRVIGDSIIVANTEVNDSSWTRVTHTFTLTGSGNLIIYPVYNISGTSTLFNAYIWGAQLEENSYATSYIKTVGTAQTRVADNASLLNLDTNNLVTDSGSWTVLFEIELLSNESAMDKIRLTDASGSPRAYLYHSSMGVAGTDWTGGTSIPMNTNNKLIYRANSTQSITAFNNGVNISTMTSTSTPIVFNRILFYGSNGAFKIKQMQVFNTTLSDTECINLTTI